MTVFIGTSGWVYRSWRGRFYPLEAHQGRWLQWYAAAFASTEINATFYRLPERRMVEGWSKRTPEDFVFAVKMSRLVTHVRRLSDVQSAVETFLATISPLGTKLGPILLQLPPGFEADVGRLDATLKSFLPRQRVTCEFRHPSWFTSEVFRLLERHDAALCLADRDGQRVTPLVRTASWGYVRFHSGGGEPHPGYAPSELERWADELVSCFGHDSDLYLYFNNDALACAPHDAAVLGTVLRVRGMSVTRTPDPARIAVG